MSPTKAAPTLIELDGAVQAVEQEEELEGPMPEDVWREWTRVKDEKGERWALEYILRETVRKTKRNIIERMTL